MPQLIELLFKYYAVPLMFYMALFVIMTWIYAEIY